MHFPPHRLAQRTKRPAAMTTAPDETIDINRVTMLGSEIAYQAAR